MTSNQRQYVISTSIRRRFFKKKGRKINRGDHDYTGNQSRWGEDFPLFCTDLGIKIPIKSIARIKNDSRELLGIPYAAVPDEPYFICAKKPLLYKHKLRTLPKWK